MWIPVAFLLAAIVLNSTVIIANHGLMPVSGYYDSSKVEDGTHTLLTSETKLKWLADVHGPPMARYSIGDIFAGLSMVGLFVVVVIRLCMRS